MPPPASFVIATAYSTPFGPRLRSMTGVEVMPISGVMSPQPRLSLDVSFVPVSDTCHSSAVVARIVRVHAVVFGDDVDHVARGAVDGQARDGEWLSVHLAVSREK